LVLGPSVGPNPSTCVKSRLALPSPRFFFALFLLAPPFHGTRTRERVKADAGLIHLSLSGRERERALRRSSSLSAQASGTSCLSSPLAQTKCVRPRDVFISEISSLHLLCSLSFEKNIYMQIHKLAPLAHEFPKVMTTNIMLPSCTTYTRKCVPGERVFGSEHPHQSNHFAVHTPLWSCRVVSAQREQLAARCGWRTLRGSISFDKRMARVSGVSSATRHNRGRDNQGDMDRQSHRVSRAPSLRRRRY